jgi:hypothetical protein
MKMRGDQYLRLICGKGLICVILDNDGNDMLLTLVELSLCTYLNFELSKASTYI